MESRHALSAGLVVLLALLVPAGFANAGGAEPAPVSRATIYYAWAEDQRPTSDSFEQIAEKWNCVFEFDADSDELRTLRSAFGNATDGEFAEKRSRAKVQFADGRSDNMKAAAFRRHLLEHHNVEVRSSATSGRWSA